MLQPMILWPIRFATSNPTIVVSGVGGSNTQTRTLSVNADEDYWLSGDGQTTPGERDLLERLKVCLDSHTVLGTFTVTASARNIVTINCGDAFIIEWNHANTTVDESIFGFPNESRPNSTSDTAPYMTKGIWIPGTASAIRPFRTDTREEPVTVSVIAEAIDGSTRGYQLGSSKGERTVTFHLLARSVILQEYANASEPYNTLEYAWTQALAAGRTFRLYGDHTTRTSTSYKKYRILSVERPWKQMPISTLQRYEVELKMRAV